VATGTGAADFLVRLLLEGFLPGAARMGASTRDGRHVDDLAAAIVRAAAETTAAA
jgi:hypothetical protein